VLQNDESITNAVDDTFLLSREDSGTVTVTAADDDANAALTVVAGGTGTLTLGNATNADISIVSDGVNLSETELAILDGVTSTTTQLNYLDAADGETGSGSVVFDDTPTLITPVIGAATGTSLILSGVLQGLVPVTVTTAATLVLTTANTKGDMHQNGDADAIDYTLPGAAAGLSVCFMAGEFTGVITVDPVDGTDTIYLNGASIGAGDVIQSPGTVGDFICLIAIDSTKWYTLGEINTWVDGGNV